MRLQAQPRAKPLDRPEIVYGGPETGVAVRLEQDVTQGDGALWIRVRT